MMSYAINEQDADKLLEMKNHAFAYPFHFPEGNPMGAHRIWRPNSAFWNPNMGISYLLDKKKEHSMHQDWEEWHGKQGNEK